VTILVLILLVVVVAAIGAALVIRRRQAGTDTAAEPVRVAPAAPEPAPMSDLEAALAKVTDSTGRPIGDRIDAEAEHVDELRVPDDTGPLLRRALDHVAKPDADQAAQDDTDRPVVDGDPPPTT